MSPQWTSVLSVLFVIMAAVQVWLMLEVIGRDKPKFNERTLSLAHRINGYLFLFLYLIFLFVMVKKVANSNQPLDTKTIIHMTMAVSIIPLLLVKIMIVRFYPKAFDIIVPPYRHCHFYADRFIRFHHRRLLPYQKHDFKVCEHF